MDGKQTQKCDFDCDPDTCAGVCDLGDLGNLPIGTFATVTLAFLPTTVANFTPIVGQLSWPDPQSKYDTNPNNNYAETWISTVR